MSGLFVSVVDHRVRRWIWVVVHGGGGGKEGMFGLKVPGSERYERIRTTFGGGERNYGGDGIALWPSSGGFWCSRTRILCG